MEQSWSLSDALELRQDYEYTFYTPSRQVLEQLIIGDLVRLRFAFESNDPAAPQAERMWVEIATRNGRFFTGYLTNAPTYIQDLALGDVISFDEGNIISTQYEDPENIVEQFINRCYVSNQVLREKQKVRYLYREESLGERDGFLDTGWRIMSGVEMQEYLDDPSNAQFVSLGAVLNIDDSSIHLLDEPVGCQFEWNEEQSQFVRVMD